MDPKRKHLLEKDLTKYFRIITLIFLVLILRLGWLQLFQAELYKTRADENRMRLVPIPAPRGNIITQDGVVLATDYPSFRVSISYSPKLRNSNVVENLANLLEDPEVTAEYINNLIKERSSRLYEPIVVKRNIPIETVTRLESHRSELPGIIIEPAPERTYTHENMAGHLLGFIGEINDKELGKEGYEIYKLGDILGKAGIEKQYDTYIRGKNGFRQVEVNVQNRPIKEITTITPIPGDNIHLTIDYNLQRVMEEEFDTVLENLQKIPHSSKANAGAGVLLDVRNGKVLAMVTRPNDKIRVQNKAIQGRYIPGSTIKMITGIAALEKGIDPNEKVTCGGRYWIKPYIKCTGVHGPIDYYHAIAKSCNVYFQEMGRRVTVDGFAKIGQEFGLDKATGIDLPYESSGATAFQGLPTSEKRNQYFEWAKKITNSNYTKKITAHEKKYNQLIAEATDEKEKNRLKREQKNSLARLKAQWKIDLKWNSNWHEVDTFNIAIGQGRQNYTPLQLANYVATIANGGTRYQPYVVEKILDYQGNVVKEFHPQVEKVVDVSEKTLEQTRLAMMKTAEPGGTANFLFRKFPEEIKVAAKTGTAQPGQGYEKNEFNGVFVAFAPADNPEIAFAGVVEYGYSGGGSAGRIAKAVFEEYFGLNKKSQDNVESAN